MPAKAEKAAALQFKRGKMAGFMMAHCCDTFMYARSCLPAWSCKKVNACLHLGGR